MKLNGRPTKLTPEVKERFLNAIRIGATYELACSYAGITYRTLLNWRERQREPYLQFFQDVLEAEGHAAIQWLALLEKHSHADARWAAWKLERRYPEHFGRREKVQITIADADHLIDEACKSHNLPLPETFGGEPVAENEM